MKKYFSVFLLFLKQSFPLALLISIGNIFINGLMMFIIPLVQGYGDYFQWPLYTFIIFIILLSILLFAILADERGHSASSYTLSRLRIPESSIIMCRFVVNALCLTIFWLSGIVAICLNCEINIGYLAETTAIWRYVFIYSNRLLLGLFPIDLYWIWLRNIFYIITLALVSAMSPTDKKAGKGSALLLCYILVNNGLPYRTSSDTSIIFVMILSLILIIYISKIVEIRKQKRVYFYEQQV